MSTVNSSFSSRHTFERGDDIRYLHTAGIIIFDDTIVVER